MSQTIRWLRQQVQPVLLRCNSNPLNYGEIPPRFPAVTTLHIRTHYARNVVLKFVKRFVFQYFVMKL